MDEAGRMRLLYASKLKVEAYIRGFHNELLNDPNRFKKLIRHLNCINRQINIVLIHSQQRFASSRP